MADRKKRAKTANLPATKEQASAKADLEKAAGTLATSGIFNAVGVIQPLQKNLAGEHVTADGIYSALEAKLKTVQAGDMTAVESMLLSQATALQSLFASLARKAAAQEYLKQYQTHLTLALKAQAQSRATLEALIELKQPRHAPTFVKQANIAHGHQQVNNGTPSPARSLPTEPSKLLEDTTHERLDIGAQAAPGRGHQELETVGAVNRPAERRG